MRPPVRLSASEPIASATFGSTRLSTWAQCKFQGCHVCCHHEITGIFPTTRDTIKDSIERETQGKLELMNKSVVTSKDIVIKDLLSRVVCEVQPKLHTNLRLA